MIATCRRTSALPLVAWCVATVLVTALPTGTAAAAPTPVGSTAQSATAQSAAAVPSPPETPPGQVPRSACGAPLSDADLARLRVLASPPPDPAATTLGQFERRVAASRGIHDLLAARGDRRGLFGVGLDEVESDPVLPMQRRGVAPDPEWARRVSLTLLEPYLAAVHAHFTGAPVQEHWQRFFDLATDCRQRPAFVAMTGYNAHLTVDLARAVAASRTRPDHAPGYLEIVGGIADHRDLIIDRTRREYGADLGPLWNLYAVGPAVDSITGPGVGSGTLLRFGDQAYSSLAFVHGLALQDPAVAPAAAGQVRGLWADADVALQSITRSGGL